MAIQEFVRAKGARTPDVGTRLPQAAPRRGARVFLRDLLVRAGLYPHVTLQCMPFKTYEFRALLARAPFTGNERVLDLGCGIGTQTIIVGRRCREIVGVDICEHSIQTAKSNAFRFAHYVNSRFLCGNVEKLELEGGSFDRVLSFCVIEHIPNYPEVLAELHRLLRPGGDLILSADSLETITDPELLAKHSKDNHVVTYFREETLRRALEEAGFKDIEIKPIFRSEFARRLFCRGIRTGFVYGYFAALAEYYWLSLRERLARTKNRGIFLVASCRK